jgi:hypothetical protein
MLPLPTESPDLPVSGSGGGSAQRPWQPRGQRVTLLAAAALLLLVTASFAGGWRLGRASAPALPAAAAAPVVRQPLFEAGAPPRAPAAPGAGGDAASTRAAMAAAESVVDAAQRQDDAQLAAPLLAADPEEQAAAQEEALQGRAEAAQEGAAAAAAVCSYGSLRGSWVSDGGPGTHWRVFDRKCQLRNLLELYKAAAGGGRDGEVSGGGGGGSSSGGADPPELRLLLLSDSVDRYITGHLCEWLGGRQEAQVAREMLPAAQAAGSVPAGTADAGAADGGAARRPRLRRRRSQEQAQPGEAPPTRAPDPEEQQQQRQQEGEQQQQETSGGQDADSAASASPAPTNVYTTAYSLHKCVTPAPVRIASSYFPGVHPTGPWHRNLAQSYRQRIDSAAALWRDYAGDQPPHLVVGWWGDWRRGRGVRGAAGRGGSGRAAGGMVRRAAKPSRLIPPPPHASRGTHRPWACPTPLPPAPQSVSSLLWDMARMWFHERHEMGGPELRYDLLQGWAANFTDVVRYARQVFPQVRHAGTGEGWAAGVQCTHPLGQREAWGGGLPASWASDLLRPPIDASPHPTLISLPPKPLPRPRPRCG